MKHSKFISIVALSLVFLGASCSVGTKSESNMSTKSDTKSTTDQQAGTQTQTATADPADVMSDFLTNAQQGNKGQYQKYLVSGLNANEGIIFPKKLETYNFEIAPALEFGLTYRLMSALFTPKDSSDTKLLRYVYLLEQRDDSWAIFDVQIGGSMRPAEPNNTPIVGDIDVETSVVKMAQDNSEKTEYAWRKDPYLVALADSVKMGFDPTNDAYTITDQSDKSAQIEVIHGEDYYSLSLKQPEKNGDDGVWFLTKVVKK